MSSLAARLLCCLFVLCLFSIPAVAFEGPNKRQPWQRYAVSYTPQPEKAKVVIIIDDLGVNPFQTAKFNEMPGPLTLAFLPYADDVAMQSKAAKSFGHEIMLHMPMEPQGHKHYPGPNALYHDLSEEELLERLQSNLAQFDGYVGINNHMGSRMTTDHKGMEVVMRELQKRGLLFVDSVTSGASLAGDVASFYGVPSAKRDVFLDHYNDAASVKKALRQLERRALTHGHAIGIGHPYPTTVAALEEWLPTLEEKGIQLVPVSAVVETPDYATAAR